MSSRGIAFVHGPEQAAEVVPDRPRVVGVGVAVGLGDGLRRQQAAILAKGDEQHAVEDRLRGGEHAGRRHGGVALAQAVKGLQAQVGVIAVVVARQFQADAPGFGQQVVEVAAAGRGDHPLGAEQEDEAAKGRVVAGQGRRLEALEGELVVSLVVEADFVQVA